MRGIMPHVERETPFINIQVYEGGYLITVFNPPVQKSNEMVEAFREMIPMIRKENGEDWKNQIDNLDLEEAVESMQPVYRTIVAKTWEEVLAVINLFKPEAPDIINPKKKSKRK